VDIQATSIFVSSLSPENNVEYVAQFGIDPHIWELYPKTTPIFAKYPITDAMRTRKTTWINTLPDWGDEYPLLKPIEFPGKERTFIGMAIEKCGTPVAAVGIFAMPVIEIDGETDAFLGTIANVLALYLYDENDQPEVRDTRSGNSAVMKKVKRDEALTERQMLILKMISENRTNILISELLGYSESTIRQETIKIYAKLGCNGREEASRIYKENLRQEVLVS
jgi:DNA-binding CsgD family transcriptional regulator